MNEIGSWWGDVVEGTGNLPIPQDLKDSLLFAEGFIGAAGSGISATAIGAVDLGQLVGISAIADFNVLTGQKTPEWKNTRMYEVEIRISKGETLSIGKVVPQKISSSGTVLKGGADQILLPQDLPLEWITDFRIVPN